MVTTRVGEKPEGFSIVQTVWTPKQDLFVQYKLENIQGGLKY